MQANDPLALRAGRSNDLLGSRGAQFVDQPQHRRGGRLRPVAGEQARPVLDGPRQPPQVALPPNHAAGSVGGGVGSQRGIQAGNDGRQHDPWVALVAIRAPVTARLPCPVTTGDRPLLAAGRAPPQRPLANADRAVPVLAVALHPGQLPPAGGTPWRGDPVAPAARSASSRSPTAVGAGERPLVSTGASPASAAAKRRRLARPPLLCATTWRTVSWSSVGSTAATTATTVPIGSTSVSSPGCVIGRSE